VLAQLLQLLQNTGTYVNYYFNSWYDLQLDFEQEAYDDIVKNINDIAPRKIRETAYNLTQFERYLAKYVTDGWLSWNPLENYLDTTWSDLADYLELNAEDVICGLFTSLNAAQAATVLTDETDAFLAASTLSETTQSYVKTALLGIISSEGDFIKLLTTQDSDILGFTLTYECDGCGWVDPGEEWTYDQVNDWWYIYGQCSSDVPAGNEQSGDGEADEVHAGPYQIAYHQVTFSGKTIGANAVLNCNYKSLSGAYGNYQFGLLINGEWITGLGFSAGQGSDVWVWVGLDLSAYQGDTLSGVRFGFTSSTGGHTFGVDGWRARNIPGGV
jgi:hypothetical protein